MSYPADSIIAKLPNYDNFGRKTKLRLNPENIPDLHWELATLANTISVTTTSYSAPKSDPYLCQYNHCSCTYSCLLNKPHPYVRNIYLFIFHRHTMYNLQ